MRAAVVAVAVVAGGGCGSAEGATEMVVRIDSDLPTGGGTDVPMVRLLVGRVGYPPSSLMTYVVGPGHPIPAEIPVVPSDGDTSTAVEIEVDAVGTTDTYHYSAQARVHFTPGHVTEVRFHITDYCAFRQTMSCASTESCDGAGCTAIDRDPLPDYAQSGP
jgi:hypothetical protein